MFDPNYIANYVQFRFWNRTNGALVTIGGGIGTLMQFSNLEIKGVNLKTEAISTQIFETYGGNSAQMPITQPRSFEFTIGTYEAITLWKLQRLNEIIGQGHRVEFWVEAGDATWNGTSDIQLGSVHWQYATVEYTQGRAQHQANFRGLGPKWENGVGFKVREASLLVIPSLPTATSQEIDDENNNGN